MSTERDTHFQGFANRQFPELSQRFFTLYAAITDHKDIQEIDAIEDEIRMLIARRAYDLVKHATEHIYKDAIYTEAPNYDKFMLAIVPDLTEFPPIE